MNLEVNGIIYQIDPHDFKLKDIIKLQEVIVDQHGFNAFLNCCYDSIMGNPENLNEQQYEYYLHELYDDYPIF